MNKGFVYLGCAILSQALPGCGTATETKTAAVAEESSTSPCSRAMAHRTLCNAASERALAIIKARDLEAVTVVQDVRTGALLAFAASRPSTLDVATPVPPLSLSKLLLSASWWDNRLPEAEFDSTKGRPDSKNPAYRSRVSVHEMLVGGSDSAGRQMALALRNSVGAATVAGDFRRYGFEQRPRSGPDSRLWAELDPVLRGRLTPPPAFVALSPAIKDPDWANTLSLGEVNMRASSLHISRFLQAVGNGGMMIPPVAREQPASTTAASSAREIPSPVRVMQERTALRLQAAMRDAVTRGTAVRIAAALADTGWQIGGKTGTGGSGPNAAIGPESDGWFAGLIFDPQGKARFTVATFVRHGGAGGGNAAQISAELARYIIGAKAE
jgi:membrane peptidoglycan carboxypeptidase